MNEQAMRFRLGLFVLATLVILGVLIVLFGGLPTLFRSFYHYTVTFTDALEVSPGTPVRRAGVRIGEVERVELDDETGKVHVHIRVEKRHPLRRSDQPVLVHGLFGGDAYIDFVPRRVNGQPPDRTLVEPGGTVEGRAQADTGKVLQQASDFLPPAQDTLADFRKALITLEKSKALERMSETLLRLNLVLNDDNLRNLNETLKNVRIGSERLDSITRNTDELLKDSRQTILRVNTAVTRLDEVLTNLQQATKPLSDRSGAIARNLEESTARLNRTLYDVQEAMRVFFRTDGTLQRLLTDPGLYNHLDEAACLLTQVLPHVDRAVKDLELFADKVARHPETIGLGGLVYPSSGLKR
jgi:phospholipid/cholesterol/gamma-HCH transport system substrate-binding protein